MLLYFKTQIRTKNPIKNNLQAVVLFLKGMENGGECFENKIKSFQFIAKKIKKQSKTDNAFKTKYQ